MEERTKLSAFEYADLRRKILEDWANDQEKADKALDFIIGDAILPLDEPLTSSQLFELRKEAYKGHINWGWDAVIEAYKYAIKGLKIKGLKVECEQQQDIKDMEEFVFARWVLDQEDDKMVSVYRWGSRTGRSGLMQRIRVALTLGKGDNPSMLEIYDDDTDEVQSVECNDLPDLLNKMEVYLEKY